MASLHHNTSLSPFPPQIKPEKSPQLIQTHCKQLYGNGKNPEILTKSYFTHISSLCKDGQLQEAVDLLNRMEAQELRIGPEFYGELLQGCVYQRELLLGQQVHAKIIKNGKFFARNEFIETKLVIFYAKCDLFDVSSNLFSRLRLKNEFSWAAMIGLYSRVGLFEEALLGFIEMQENGISADNFVLPNVLKACGALNNADFGKCVHGQVWKLNFDGCVFVASSLIDMYGKCGALGDARKVFDNMSKRNVVAWNSIIGSYMQNGFNEEAIQVFSEMRIEGFEASRVTLSSILTTSANLRAFKFGKQVHAIAIQNGLDLDNILGTSLINFYSKVGLASDAELVFSRMIEKDVVAWNLLIFCYVQSGEVEKALSLCREMRSAGFLYDCVTLSSLLSASTNLSDLNLGKAAHCFCLRNHFESDAVVANSIVDMYAKCKRITDARQVFDSTADKDIVSWNTLLAAYAEMGFSGETLKLFYQMQLDGVQQNIISWNLVILGFLRNGQINEATDMFSQMKASGVHPNHITYTTLITGLSQIGFGNEAIMFFQQMLEAGLEPTSASIVGVLSACTNMASLLCGKAIHGYNVRRGIPLSLPMATSLVDMYSKCGNLNMARQIFDAIAIKEIALYNAMISGYALHGRAVQALGLFEHLKKEGVEPDNITFTTVLASCCHIGLVNEGLNVFHEMVSVYNVEPGMQHYGCLATLLSRCGNVYEALHVVQKMPFDPDGHALGSLLAACRELGESELEEHIAKSLIKMFPDNSGNYVALSNAYATSGRWDGVSELRDLMKRKGLRKSPGCSWIQNGNELHAFVAGDRSHSQTPEIYAVLALLEMEMSAQ
ncbi:PREDICTED: pentatricopeptide repeat-containing protein At5g55740, chloroplastic [Ipomoea nil]|uniref:pentatricopeptide repeat-containing protein At5g55740, chloroplastic n=1 Tax=Ipomoea nil TaxID=35883 RepID=UPI000900B8FE|nr:PREDICTED: pentatricopeptide repeat-containing protein At5g55740, chloroplastic [Ipomoea nil]